MPLNLDTRTTVIVLLFVFFVLPFILKMLGSRRTSKA